MPSGQCYKCGGKGHKESDCDPKTTGQFALSNEISLQPAFVFVIRGLSRVVVSGMGRSETVVPPIGLTMSYEPLRIQHTGDRITMFGRPDRETVFVVLLPNSSLRISFRWNEYRFVMQNRFVFDEKSFRTVFHASPVRPADPEFVIQCSGQPTSTFGIDCHSGDDIISYRAFVRGELVVAAPVQVAMQIRLWTREDDRRKKTERAEEIESNMHMFTQEMIEDAVNAVSALELNEQEA